MWRAPKWTRQYVGGVLAGLGIGILFGLAVGLDLRIRTNFVRWPLQVAAILLLPVGQSLALKGQDTQEPG